MSEHYNEIKFTFLGHTYWAGIGATFQAYIKDGVANTTYKAIQDDGTCVTVKVVERITPNISLMRVTMVDYTHKNKVHVLPEEEGRMVLDKSKSSLSKMTKNELIAYVKKYDIDVNTKLKKKDLIKAIEEALGK